MQFVVLVRLHEHVEDILQLQGLLTDTIDKLVFQLLINIFRYLDSEAERCAAEGFQVVQEGGFQFLF